MEKLVKKQVPDCDTELFASGKELLRKMIIFDIIRDIFQDCDRDREKKGISGRTVFY